jgi:hypothetical protein
MQLQPTVHGAQRQDIHGGDRFSGYGRTQARRVLSHAQAVLVQVRALYFVAPNVALTDVQGNKEPLNSFQTRTHVS